MDQGVQEHAYQTLPRRDSDSHLPAGQGGGEHGIQFSALSQDGPTQEKPPGGAPGGPTAPDATAAAAGAADLPTSELELHKAWRLIDCSVALFLCTSIVHFIIRLTVTAGVCGCISIVAAIAHLWRRWQLRARGGNSAEACRKSMFGFVGILFLLAMVLIFSFAIWGAKCCLPEGSSCRIHLVFAATWLYFLVNASSGFIVEVQGLRFFPPPPRPKQRPYKEVLRERIQQYAPLSAEALRDQEILQAKQQVEAEETAALYAFQCAEAAGDRLKQNEAHRLWQEVVGKLKLVNEDPEQYLQQYGPPCVAV